MSAPPDLMLVDVALPYLSGLDFVATLKADTTVPDVPVVFITGQRDVVERARALGAPCLRKPFSAEQLLEVVRRELQLRPPRRRARLDYLSAST
jgi:DNA-binding response OmpR family regulator